MSTVTLTGTYFDYFLNSSVVTLTNLGTLSGTAGAGGTGSSVGFAATNGVYGTAGLRLGGGTVNNNNVIAGGAGGSGGAANVGSGSPISGNGGVGGYGVSMTSGLLVNTGTIHGGKGGDGGVNNYFPPGKFYSGFGGYGGNGGGGVSVASASVINSGRIAGGAGGSSGAYNAPGGLGVVASAGASVTNTNHGSITGFNGVYLSGGSYLGNQLGGFVNGYDGVIIAGATSNTVINAGYILGSGGVSSVGVALFGAGVVTNLSTGTIAGGSGIVGRDQGETVINSGDIASTAKRTGIAFYTAGSVVNMSTGTISGNIGISGRSGALTVVNAGVVSGAYNPSSYLAGSVPSGIDLNAAGTVVNQSGGTISGKTAIYAVSAAVTVTNAGSIAGYIKGVSLVAGGALTNASTGRIHGGRAGVGARGAATVTNAGYIGGGTYAVSFNTGSSNRLVIDPGAIFVGTVAGGNAAGSGAVSTLELASGASSGTLSGLGTHYVGFSQITIDSGAHWTFNGTNTISAGYTLTLNGATLTDAGVLVNNGGIILDPSTMVVGSLTGTGSVTIQAGATLEVQGYIAPTETIVFQGAGGYLHLDHPGLAHGHVTGFYGTDSIDLGNNTNPASVSFSSGNLYFGGTYHFPLSGLTGASVGAVSSPDGADVTPLCFLADALIQTPAGQVKVQDLKVGDVVQTFGGAECLVAWIGHGMALATRGKRGPATPVIVRKHALGSNVPFQDLRVTKGHSFFIDGVLIPVEFLVNHRTIAWDDRAQEVDLFHVELDTHDVLIANGAPAESYRDDGNRWLFRNANSGWGLAAKEPCAPVLTGGPIVDAVWRRLLDRASPRPGLPLSADPNLHLLADGHRLNPVRFDNGRCEFTVPGGVSELRIVSRAGAPQELGLARDPRVLGVAIRQLRLWAGRHLHLMEAADPALLGGFHAYEADNDFRWTDGFALVPKTFTDMVGKPFTLEIVVGATTQYPLLADAGSSKPRTSAEDGWRQKLPYPITFAARNVASRSVS